MHLLKILVSWFSRYCHSNLGKLVFKKKKKKKKKKGDNGLCKILIEVRAQRKRNACSKSKKQKRKEKREGNNNFLQQSRINAIKICYNNAATPYWLNFFT